MNQITHEDQRHIANLAAAGKIEVVQALRFFAAAMVLLTHTTFYLQERVLSTFPIWKAGASGVPIFFVISGIVIVLASEKLTNDSAGAATFLRHRVARIVPLYWLLTTFKVALALAIPAAVLHNHFDVVHAIKSYLFIPAFNQAGEIRPIHGVGWTLLHEMYLFSLAMTLRVQPVPAVAAFICAAFAFGQIVDFDGAVMLVATSSENLHFVIGMALGLALLRNTYSTRQAVFLFGVASSAVVAARLGGVPTGVDPYALAVACGIPLLVRLTVNRATMLFSKLGESSYSLYLIHPIAASGMVAALGKVKLSPVLILIVVFFATVTVSHLIHLFVEKPLVRRVRRFLDTVGRRKPSERLA